MNPKKSLKNLVENPVKFPKFRWIIPKITKKSCVEFAGEKTTSQYEKHAERVLQYSLDGENWVDVESVFIEVPNGDTHKYKWDNKDYFIANVVNKE